MLLQHFNNSIISEDVWNILDNPLPWETFRNKTVLITGASGMIPSYVLYTFLGMNDKFDMNVKVLALVRNEAKARKIFGSLLERDDIQLVVQDVCEPVQTEEAVDYIFHGGSAARPSAHKVAPTATIRANLTGTFNLLDLAVEKKTQGFVLMSSSEVYGTVGSEIDKIQESDYGTIDILNTRSCYSEGKRAAETICSCYQAQYGIACKLPRFAHIYGPGMLLDDERVQTDFASKVFYGKDIVLNSDGSAKRAYTYIADAVSGIFYILLKGDEMAYNVADSNSIISIRELAEHFIAARPEKNLSLKFNIAQELMGMYNPAKFIGLDGAKLESLGWKATTSIAEGCHRMLKHFEITET